MANPETVVVVQLLPFGSRFLVDILPRLKKLIIKRHLQNQLSLAVTKKNFFRGYDQNSCL